MGEIADPMRKIVIALSLYGIAFAQQLQGTILKNEVVPYDESRRKVVVDVNHVGSRLIGKVFVILHNDGTNAVYRREVDFANSVKRRQTTFEVKNEEGPWRVEIEEAWSGL